MPKYKFDGKEWRVFQNSQNVNYTCWGRWHEGYITATLKSAQLNYLIKIYLYLHILSFIF